MSVKAKYIKDLPLKNELDGSESLLVQDSNGTKQAPLEAIVDEIKQNSQEKIREIEKRMDTFVAVGESTDNAETVDIRVGADGVVYGSAGEAVRQQVNYLKEKDYDVSSSSFKPNYTLNVGYLNGDGRISTENGDFRYSTKIELLTGQVIRVTTKSIPKNVTIIAEYLSDTELKPLVIADSREYKSYYYQAPKNMYVSFCVTKDNTYKVDIVYDISSQMYNSFFNKNKEIVGDNTYKIRVANSFEEILDSDWKAGYYDYRGVLSRETGRYINLQLEPNTKYLVVVGGYYADTTIVGLDNLADTNGTILNKYKGEKVHVLSFVTPLTGIVGICTNNNILDTTEVVLTKDFGLLKDIVQSLIDDEANIFEVEYTKGEVIPNIVKNGNLLTEQPTYTQGYWTKEGVFKTETALCFSLQLEANTSYLIYVGGYSSGINRGITSIVGLDSLSLTNGVPLSVIPDGANIIEFKTKASGIVGICTNEKHVKKENILLFKKESGLITQALLTFVDEFVDEKMKNENGIICHVGNEDYKDEDNYYADPISCFKAIQNYKGKKIVNIYNGVYDIYELMGGYDYFSTLNPETQKWDDVQPVLDNVEIICHGDVVFNMELPLTLSNKTRFLISPLNLRGNFSVNNLTINAVNCRYCIHDEGGGDFPNTTHEYNNVICNKIDGTAVGCGYSKNSTVKISNCHFESDTYHAYSYHSKGGCNLIIDNTILKSSNAIPLRLSEENSKRVDKAVISNTALITNNNQKLEMRGEWDYDNPIGHTEIRLINTNITSTNQIKNGYNSNTREVVSFDSKLGTETVLIEKS